METATFAGGCFWGVEARFRRINGVAETCAGYTGGQVENPTYEQVCGKKTGHAEAVRVTFDPEKVSYDQLLSIFWTMHNPTTKNRQGLDIGPQYRSAVFYHSEKQREKAENFKRMLEEEKRFSKPVVMEIVPAGPFYPAGEEHQRYLEKRGRSDCLF